MFCQTVYWVTEDQCDVNVTRLENKISNPSLKKADITACIHFAFLHLGKVWICTFFPLASENIQKNLRKDDIDMATQKKHNKRNLKSSSRMGL